MNARFESIREKFEYLQKKITDVEVIRDQSQYLSCLRELKLLEPVMEKYERYRKKEEHLRHCDELLSGGEEDEEILALAREERDRESRDLEILEEEMNQTLQAKIKFAP